MEEIAGRFNQRAPGAENGMFADLIAGISRDRPVLIAGPTASGKSALALAVAEAQGGVVVNADALQVWSCWRILSARPSPQDEDRADHRLYGHRAPGDDYSVGRWLREVRAVMDEGRRPIIVGGTGLYLTALTEGLAEIPPVSPDIRAEADRLLAARGREAMLADIDPVTAGRIDRLNPARVQRAWEVQRATGRGLAEWHARTRPPLLPLQDATALLLQADRTWLAQRIDARFDAMIAAGALDEVRAMLPFWNPRALWARAIGASDLSDCLLGSCDLPAAVARAKAQSRQYARRQRMWFRRRMGGWQMLELP